MTTFDTFMGKLHFNYREYCIGCQYDDPSIRLCLKIDANGNLVRDKDGEPINEGYSISCCHRFLCQNIARDTANRLGETTDE